MRLLGKQWMSALGLALLLGAWLWFTHEQRPGGMHLEGMVGMAAWHVTIADPPAGTDEATLAAGIAQAFFRSSKMIATWDNASEVSHFNAHSGDDWFPVSPDLAKLVDTTLQLSRESAGVYDVTIRPLVELWGFGSALDKKDVVPDQAAIDAARAKVGYQKLQVRLEPPALRKAQPDLLVELASVADGFAADQAGQYLESLGIHHYMVEIAGEIRTRGKSLRGDEWRVAIEKPQDDAVVMQQGIRLQDKGLATSGDYRNFFTKNGKRYSHTIDPATGYPVAHKLASVSVLADQATLADGYATLLMAMGEEKGKAFADQHGLAAFFIWRTDNGFATYATPSFATHFL
jgi:thiamine biosynthesis lipoprotein